MKLFSTSRCAVLTICGTLTLASTTATAPRIHGVSAENSGTKYAMSDLYFTCFDGSAKIAANAVNDDYCDCADGSDEPGTSACSHTSMTFHCENNLPILSRQIPTSRLNDTVCDCCDGSDEFDVFHPERGSPCENTCVAEIERNRREAKQRLETISAGNSKRMEILQRVKDDREAHKVFITGLEKQITTLEVMKKKVELYKTREEKVEYQLRITSAREKSSSRVYNGSEQCLENDAQCSVDDGVSMNEDQSNEDQSNDEKKPSPVEEFDYGGQKVLFLKNVELSNGSETTLSAYMKGVEKLSKEYTPKTAKEMRREGFLGPYINGGEQGVKKAAVLFLQLAGLVVSPIRAVYSGLEYLTRKTLCAFNLELPSVYDTEAFRTFYIKFRAFRGGMVFGYFKWLKFAAQTMWDAPLECYAYMFPVLDETIVRREISSLNEISKQLNTEIAALRREIQNGEKANQNDFGPDQVFSIYKSTCIETQVTKYKYRVCPFNKVEQDHVLVGKWQHWGTTKPSLISGPSSYDVMSFNNGIKCWNGPKRSAMVKLVCGSEERIVEVDEPSICTYELTVELPAVCSNELLQAAKLEAEKWN